ncbi:MAG: polyphosphate kinase 2 family protein [Roseibacillus sp.]|jgi:PPK2 family polyphosphate:nucleotide phosphotransferase
MDDSADSRHKLDHGPLIVPPGERISLGDYDPRYCEGLEGKSEGRKALLEDKSDLAAAQTLLWANSKRSVLIILQALDAAGKDGAIKHVMSGVNPQGVTVQSFKAPTSEERLHHFLWRPAQVLPPRGRIAIFNRSYYEEVLVVRVHPAFLDSQFLPERERDLPLDELWQSRYAAINDFEKRINHDADITILKFFLNVSKDEQRERFIERLERPEKNWKFSGNDLRERGYWDAYQEAYQDMLSATSTEDAPWHVIPADRKWFARAAIADIITRRIGALNLQPPELSEEQREDLTKARQELGI